MDNLVVIGGGYAATVLITTLRQLNYANPIVWIMGEPYLPYDRPHLSKDFLSDATVKAPPFLVTQDKLKTLNVEVHQGLKATSIERKTKTVHLENGTNISYGNLVIATGGRARKLPFPAAIQEQVSYIRELKEATILKEKLKKCKSVLIIGGGWIGLEMAAAATKLGLKTSLVEKAPRIVARVLPESVASWLEGVHRNHGVQFFKNNAVKNIEKVGTALKVELENGTILNVDHLIVGIGMIPNDELASAAGIAVKRGITTNVEGWTSDKYTYAIGDVANAFVSKYDQYMRMESWENAQWQAVRLAQLLAKKDITPMPAPWFWSDQYDKNIQMVGIDFSGKGIQRKYEDNKWIKFYLNKKDQIIACIGINVGREMRSIRKLINEKTVVELDLLSQPSVNIKNLAPVISEV